jgi:ABC-type branched-subunit amino acid transport system substrate-binding protein
LDSRGRRSFWRAICAGLVVVLVAGCAAPIALPGDAAPVVKIGLIAPFEGLGRPLGYAVLPAVKLAVTEANASGRLGRYQVALTALNDDIDAASAAKAAAALAQDPDLLAAIGPWDEATAASAAPVLAQAGIPVLAGAPLDRAARSPHLPGVFSLCPDPAQIAQALLAQTAVVGAPEVVAAGPHDALDAALLAAAPGTARAGVDPLPPTATVIYTGDAAGAADAAAGWYAAGWRGQLLGGPDVVRPWFAARAGTAAEGAEAVVCADAGYLPGAPTATPSAVDASFEAAYQKQAGAPPTPAARLAYAATRRLLDALARDIAAHGHPTRAALTADLAAAPLAPQAVWMAVRDGQWIVSEKP